MVSGIISTAAEEALESKHARLLDISIRQMEVWVMSGREGFQTDDVAGTLCKGEIQGTFAQEYKKCEACDFYMKVYNEECSSFRSSAELLSKINE